MTPRTFDATANILNLSRQHPVAPADGRGGRLAGVSGISGVSALGASGQPMGVDLITMAAGAAFELHQHSGDHILVVRSGRGWIHVDGCRYRLVEGDTVFVPAEYPHGVSADAHCDVSFLAFGVPHRPVDAPDRMSLLDDDPAGHR